MFLKKNKYLYAWGAVVMFYLFLNACSYNAKATKNMLAEARSRAPYDVIVVPGIQLEEGKWGKIMKGRIYWAKYLYDQGITRNIIFSGSAVYTPYYESEVMAMYARAIGIDSGHIFTESKAEHSTENLYYSYYKARQMGFTKIALASDPFQTKSLHWFARKKSLSNLGFIPMVIDTMRMLEPTMTDPQIDTAKAAAAHFVSLPDRQNIFTRFFRGTLGFNIDEKAYH